MRAQRARRTRGYRPNYLLEDAAHDPAIKKRGLPFRKRLNECNDFHPQPNRLGKRNIRPYLSVHNIHIPTGSRGVAFNFGRSGSPAPVSELSFYRIKD